MTDLTEPARPAVTYEELAELESEFDDIETEIIRKQTILQAPLYRKRAALVSKIPNFWPLVIEQAPLEIDQFIQPSDSAVLASCLRSIDVVRFEVPPAAASAKDGGQSGSPRSVSIKFTFAPNDWFHDEVLEKTFWFRRRAVDGWTGLVSVPVRIRWKGKGEDLTEGLTDVAYAAWEAEQKLKIAMTTTTTGADDDHNKSSINATSRNGKKQKEQKTHTRGTLPEYLELEKKLEESTEGSLSFFAWFGFRGRDVSAEESITAMKVERERREKIRRGEQIVVSPSKGVEPQKETDDGDADVDTSVDDHDDGDEDDELSREIFPGGEDLAIAISEDLFPNAMKYFIQAQEDDRISDVDFEEEDDGDDDNKDDDDDDVEMVDLRSLVGKGSKSGGVVGGGADNGSREKKKKRDSDPSTGRHALPPSTTPAGSNGGAATRGKDNSRHKETDGHDLDDEQAGKPPAKKKRS